MKIYQLLLRQGSVAILSKISAGLLSLSSFALLANAMHVQEFGVFGIAFSTATLLSVATSGGLNVSIFRWRAEIRSSGDENGSRYIVWSAGKYLVALNLLVTAFAIAAEYSHISPFPQSGLLVATCLLAATLSFSDYISSVVRYEDRMALSLLPRDLWWRLATCLIPIYFVSNSVSLTATTAVFLLSATLMVSVLFQVAVSKYRDLSFWKSKRDHANMRSLVGSGLPIWISTLLFTGAQNADILVMGALSTTSEAGVYFATLKISGSLGLLLVASNMISSHLIPKLYFEKKIDELQDTVRLIILLVAAPTILIASAIILFRVEILTYFGGEYVVGASTLVVLCVSFAFNAACGPTGLLLQMTGHERPYLRTIATSYSLGVLLMVMLVPIFGALGAAVGNLFATVCWNMIARSIAIREIGIDPTIFGIRFDLKVSK